MTEATNPNRPWNDELVAELNSVVGEASPVLSATVIAAATMLGISTRRVSSKLRKMGIEVESMAKSKTSTFTSEEGEALADFVVANSGELTYRDISETFAEGKFNPKQVQGKILAMELTEHVKAADPIVLASKYTELEQATYIAMAEAGNFLEEIAESLGHEIKSIRGKGLSLLTAGLISKIPAQRDFTAKAAAQLLGDIEGIADMTVAQIATDLDRTERGIKTSLTRQGVSCKDYDGAKKHLKAQAKREAAED
jgi:hypothetical protein